MRHSSKWVVMSLVWVAVCIPAAPAAAQAPGFAEITQPTQGGTATGVATLEGTAYLPTFDHYDLAFAYSQNPTDTWFPIGDEYRASVQDGRLAVWDTSGIADGTYDLRLRVWPTAGDPLIAYVRGVRVRNYTPIETGTPAPTPLSQPTATAVPASPTPFPTPMPVPATSGQTQVARAFSGGAIAGLGGLALLAGYALTRRATRSGWPNARLRSKPRRGPRSARRRRSRP